MPRTTDIKVTRPQAHTVLITLDRPGALNALRTNLLGELRRTLEAAREDDDVRAAVIAGNERAFAAGADIKEMAGMAVVDVLTDKRLDTWRALRLFPKPLIAAVAGFALGGGCELAMCCDIVIAGADARFGQPEINLGIIPGAGGTQRLPRAVGKAAAMKMVLTGEIVGAREALAMGLVAEVVQPELCVARALALAATIAAKPPLAVRLAKEAILKSFEVPLEAGLDYERRAFTSLFATEDRAEGIAAFVEKRPARFAGR